MDVLGINDPVLISELPVPLITDLVKAKIRLEGNKSKAQKAAQELEKLSGKR
jgi:ribosome assembly protein YihI (activator of Der GTPase)